MAEGIARKLFGSEALIESAGSHPGKLNPFAVTALKEKGIDISRHWSKSIDDLKPGFLVKLDYVVTLCAEEICPTMASKAKNLRWPFPDPAAVSGSDEEKLESFRRVRDSIEAALTQFKKHL